MPFTNIYLVYVYKKGKHYIPLLHKPLSTGQCLTETKKISISNAINWAYLTERISTKQDEEDAVVEALVTAMN